MHWHCMCMAINTRFQIRFFFLLSLTFPLLSNGSAEVFQNPSSSPALPRPPPPSRSHRMGTRMRLDSAMSKSTVGGAQQPLLAIDPFNTFKVDDLTNYSMDDQRWTLQRCAFAGCCFCRIQRSRFGLWNVANDIFLLLLLLFSWGCSKC